MTDKTDATFLIALIILTIVGLVVSSAAHATGPAPQSLVCCH